MNTYVEQLMNIYQDSYFKNQKLYLCWLGCLPMCHCTWLKRPDTRGCQ